MATPRILSSFVPAAALIATFAVAGVSRADSGSASRSAASVPVQHTTLPPIVPVEALLGMSMAAGLVAMVSRKNRA
jgi:hypothetical protein